MNYTFISKHTPIIYRIYAKYIPKYTNTKHIFKVYHLRIYITTISINNQISSHIQNSYIHITHRILVSSRNHLICPFLTNGHILRLSPGSVPVLTSSHINYRVAIRPTQFAHLIIHIFICDHY